MKMYKESLRRLAPIGILFAVLSLLYTVITGGQAYFGNVKLYTASSAIGLAPALVYYVFTAAIFALYGFSFLFRRAASDLYHALPVSRIDQYLSVTLATATWMGATIVLNTLATLCLLLVSGCPFVPAYLALNVPFFFVASMLVFAATAIGCALSGTVFTAIVSAGVVLFLPRFVQFILARGVVANVPIVGWLDLAAWLDPTTNIATGLVVMQTRNVFMGRMVTTPHILYSLLPMALELALGAWLFRRRPSELAEKGASGKGWSLATATLLSFVALLVITVDNQRALSVYGATVVAVSLLIFVVYQLIASRDWRYVLKTLPCFLLSAAVAFGISVCIQKTSSDILHTTPTADEIESVVFRGHDEKGGVPEYATLLLDDVAFTAEPVKEYVANNLFNAVAALLDPENSYRYGADMALEPISIRLKNGRTILRTIEFEDADELNALREREDAFYAAAIRALPDARSIQYCQCDTLFTPEENRALMDSYMSESQGLGLIPRAYYRKPTPDRQRGAHYGLVGGEQRIDDLEIAGYVGMQRYADRFNIRLEMPETASLLMRTYNDHAQADSTKRLWRAVQPFAALRAGEEDSLSLNMSFFNVPERQEKVSYMLGFYLRTYEEPEEYAKRELDLTQRFADILLRGKPTDDPTGMFLCLRWSLYDGATRSNSTSDSAQYLAFTAEDEQALVDLIEEYYSEEEALQKG